MNGFWVRTASLLAVLGILFRYNAVLENRGREEEFIRLCAQVEAMETYIQNSQEAESQKEDEQEDGLYADGEWEGQAQGFGGEISLRVKVEKGEITDISIVSAEKEDEAYLSMAETMIPAMMKAQSADVDTVTGATFSSTGIRDAVAQALKKAVKDS
ncbi:MAG: FMN-binding protein [Lachnospiraceae bacterium]|nr:FMN-binding protein [Lachnospiraceae bacterium]MCI9546198.1 FMN-binding protein [Lachnospiraceae bacterium]